MKTSILLIFICFAWSILGQYEPSPKTKAFIYHSVKTSPIFENNIGKYVDYQGPIVRFSPKKLNLDSIEKIIQVKPELLVFHKQLIASSSKGLVIELANKVALWEFNHLLAQKRYSDSLKNGDSEEFKNYSKVLIQNLPENALIQLDGQLQPKKEIFLLLHPEMQLKEKMVFLTSMRGLSEYDYYLTLNAIQIAHQTWINKRTQELFNYMGGNGDIYNGNMVAGTHLQSESKYEYREKNESGRYYLEIPKSNGLFSYQLKTDKEIAREKQITYSNFVVYKDYNTLGQQKLTNIHFDLWGYPKDQQVTVIVERNGVQYPFFTSGETRFLSPDSSFEAGKTFKGTMNKLSKKINELHELIYGKRGFDYWIAYYKKKKRMHEKEILIAEDKLKQVMSEPITTNSKPSKAVRKKKKQAMKDLSKSKAKDDIYQPTTNSNKSKRAELQMRIVDQQALFEEARNKIAELEKQKKEAIALKESYQSRLGYLNLIYGSKWVAYKKKDSTYFYTDSSYFDYNRQDFFIKGSDSSEQISIKVIANPEGPLSNAAVDVYLHSSIVACSKNENKKFHQEIINFNQEELLSSTDSLFFIELKNKLLNKGKLSITLNASGYGQKKFDQIVKAKSASKTEWKGVELQSFTEVYLESTKTNVLTFNGFVFDLSLKGQLNQTLTDLVKEQKMTTEQALSATVLLQTLKQYQTEFIQNILKYGDKTKNAELDVKLKKIFDAASIYINGKKYSLKSLGY